MKIRNKIILAIAGSFIIFSIIFSIFFIIYQQHNEHYRMQDKMLNTGNMIKKTIGDALWNIDKDRIKFFMKSFLMDPEISRIELKDKIGLNNLTMQKESISGLSLIKRRKKLFHNNQEIGEIIVHYNDSVIQEKTDFFMLLMLGITLSVIILNTLVIVLISSKLLHPLNNVIDGLKRADEGDYSHRLKISTKDEFKYIEIYFNKMISRIQKDIEERVKKERELKAAKRSAEKASMAKGYFLSSMSHEIRTPLTVIIGLIEILEMTELNEEQKSYVKRLSASSTALLDIINEVLDFSRIESGKIDLEIREFSIENLIENIVDSFIIQARAKNLEIYYFIDTNVPNLILSDRGRLRQIMLNLIGNAIKFTKEGEIYIIVKNIIERDNKVQLEFSISDTGVGIPEDSMDDIFLNYNRGQNDYTKRQTGTGLGLPIVKKLVELLGGSISFESIESKGTTFYFTINADIPGIKEKKDKDICLEGAKALLVDDNKTHLAILKTMLQEEKIDVVDISDPEAAINYLRKKRDIQFILSDVKMPGINGVELAAMVREDLKINKTPIIVYSAETTEVRGKYRNHINEIITKPIKKSKLIDIIKKTIQCENIPVWQKDADQRAGENMNANDYSVMLVEDNDMNRETTGILLKNEGYRVVLAENGKIAYELYQKERPDLILMDIQMPEMDGYETSRKIRELEEGSGFHTPIIALTAFALKITREEAKKAGMDDFIAKPVIPGDLYRRIQTYLI